MQRKPTAPLLKGAGRWSTSSMKSTPSQAIRKWGGYPEGCSFAILIMNAFTPLINRLTPPRVYGTRQRGQQQ